MSTILLMHGEVWTARKIDVFDGVDNSSAGPGVDHLEEVGDERRQSMVVLD